jgi:beta-lactamase class A
MAILKKYWFGGIVVLLIVSIVGNIVMLTCYQKNRLIGDDVNAYPFLSPRIFAEKQNDILVNFQDLRTRLRQEVAPYGDTFGLYFEYLPSGVSVGINEKVNFIAASLLKLPVAIAYLRQIERSGFSYPSPEVTIEKSQLSNGFGSLWQKGEGAKISLDKAMELSLVQSDNTAGNVLKSHVSMEDFNKVYEGLDIDVIEESGKVLISVKSYSSILKALYFSSLISKQSSERILQLLTETPFNDKLVAPIPKHIKVAHKIGVYDTEDIYQDCGIVYELNRPYVLCMFSRSTEEVARIRMNAVSKLVYEYVSQVNR